MLSNEPEHQYFIDEDIVYMFVFLMCSQTFKTFNVHIQIR